LFWKAIHEAKSLGLDEFDLGRSDFEDEGLISFKEHLGAASSELRYFRHASVQKTKASVKTREPLSSWAREALVRLPDSMLVGVGQIMYRHIG
jgi:hypothetical protein